jgi:hypothetical protein
LDDNLVGTAPTMLRTMHGIHILRVEADAYQAYGSLLPTDAGARPAVHVQLVRDPVVVALSKLTAAAGRADQTEVRSVLRRLQSLDVPIGSVWLLTTNARHEDRALVTRCTAEACEPSRRLELDTSNANAVSYGQALDPAGLGRDRATRDLAWLSADPQSTALSPQVRPTSAWWQRWYLWTAAVVIIGGGIVAGVAVAEQPNSQRLRVTVSP